MANDDPKYQAHKLPASGAGDVAHVLARAGLASIPLVGGTAVEIFSALVIPPLQRRRDQWMEEVGAALAELESQDKVNLETLRDNDAFIDAVISASQIAIRTSQEEKRAVLRNAILNSALPSPPDEARQQFFLHLVDVFTVWHIRLLDLFADPPAWFQRTGQAQPSFWSGGLGNILEAAFPELVGKRDFYDQVWKDINNYGLSGINSLHSGMSEYGLKDKHLSSLGREFMSFISAPPTTTGDDT